MGCIGGSARNVQLTRELSRISDNIAHAIRAVYLNVACCERSTLVVIG